MGDVYSKLILCKIHLQRKICITNENHEQSGIIINFYHYYQLKLLLIINFIREFAKL